MYQIISTNTVHGVVPATAVHNLNLAPLLGEGGVPVTPCAESSGHKALRSKYTKVTGGVRVGCISQDFVCGNGHPLNQCHQQLLRARVDSGGWSGHPAARAPFPVWSACNGVPV